MARPRSFDPDAVLDAASAVFETCGVEGTSVQDLVEATGLSRSSLYAAFGDKQGLYLAALDRYRRAGGSALACTLASAPTALAGLRAYLDDVAAASCGCLVFNAVAERGATDPATARRGAEGWEGLHAAFAAALRRAQTEGDLAPERDANALAGVLAAAVYGLRGLHAAGVPPEVRAAVVATTFAEVFGGR